MTRIVLIIDSNPSATYISDDPRPVRELITLINTGQMVVGLGDINLGGPPQQYASALPSQNTITVITAPPPIHLSPRHFKILHALADGKTLADIALSTNLSSRTVHQYLVELKQRFNVNTREELLVRATELGWI